MRPRYITRPRQNETEQEPWELEYPFAPTLQVDMMDAEPTHLLDARGHDIMRLPESAGFLSAINRSGK